MSYAWFEWTVLSRQHHQKIENILSNDIMSECFTFYCIIQLFRPNAWICSAPLQIQSHLSAHAAPGGPVKSSPFNYQRGLTEFPDLRYISGTDDTNKLKIHGDSKWSPTELFPLPGARCRQNACRQKLFPQHCPRTHAPTSVQLPCPCTEVILHFHRYAVLSPCMTYNLKQSQVDHL